MKVKLISEKGRTKTYQYGEMGVVISITETQSSRYDITGFLDGKPVIKRTGLVNPEVRTFLREVHKGSFGELYRWDQEPYYGKIDE